MSTEPFTDFLGQSLRAGSPLVYVETAEDERVKDQALARAAAAPGTVFMSWTCTAGLYRSVDGLPQEVFSPQVVPTFERLLAQLVDVGNQRLFNMDLVLVARDAVGPGSTSENSPDAALRFVRLMKDLYQLWEPLTAGARRRCLVFTGLGWTPPHGIAGYLQTTVLSVPRRDELLAECRDDADLAAALQRQRLDVAGFVERVAGLPLLTVRDVVRRLEQLPAPASPRDQPALALIDRIKTEEIRKTGILEVLPTDEPFDLGGFRRFKAWFAERKPFLQSTTRPELRPRGVLFVGFPGCGKSAAARWIARQLGIPLIAMNLGNVQSRWVGASEANLQLALGTLEAAAPVVVLMDEVEKDIAGHQSDSTGVMPRLVGRLLTWLNDRRAPVFIVATCNDADRIPIELSRAGRFDANFVVPVPSESERGEIVDAIGRRLGLEIRDNVRAGIVEQARDFTGAEIHQFLVEAAYKAGVNTHTLSVANVEAARPSVTPLMSRADGLRLDTAYQKKKADGYKPVGDG
jgi:hypothetical protein